MNSRQRRTMQRKASGEMLYRDVRLQAGELDEETRTVAASISSESPVMRSWGEEVLSHDARHIDLTRAEGGLPLLWMHDQSQPIGVVEGLRVEDGRMRGTLRFSRGARGQEVMQDVRDGVLGRMSIGYRVEQWDPPQVKHGQRRTAVRWSIHEASVVTVPADVSVGINRSDDDSEGTYMPDNDTGQVPEETRDAPAPLVASLEEARRRAHDEGVRAGVIAEQQRVADIRAAFARHRDKDPGVADLEDACIRNGTRVIDARVELLEYLGRSGAPLMRPGSESRMHVSGGEDALDKCARGIEDAIGVRVGIVTDPERTREIRSGEFGGMSLSEMAREWCRVAGVPTNGDKRTVVGRAFTRAISHGTSDFTSVLANISTKTLLMGYEEAPETWQTWCRIGSLPDFKQAYRVQMSAFGDLDTLVENGEYKYGTYSDHHEPLTLASYGKMFSISRQAIINDDVTAFASTARGMGRAAARKVGDLAYAVLSNGTTDTLTQDSIALWDAATHGNYVTSGAVPSATTLNAGYTAMATQTDPSGAAYLNITPRYIISSHKLRGTIRQLLDSQTDPAKSAAGIVNVWQGGLIPVFDARIDAWNADGWVLAADPQSFDTVEVAFLDGQQAPYLEERDGWSVDGVEFKVRIDAVAKALDFRGLYYNDGVT